MRHHLLVLCWLVSLGNLPGQGPVSGFMPGKGGLDLALNAGLERYGTYVFGEEKRDQQLTTRSLSLFAEYGVSEQFSLLLNVPYIHIDRQNNGLQDGELLIKYRNVAHQGSSGKFNLITGIGLSFPFSNYATDTETPIGYKPVFFKARLSAQYQWTGGFFFQLKSGVDFRMIPDALTAIPMLLRLGYGIGPFYLDGWLERYISINAGVDQNIQGGTGSSWWRTGGTLYFSFLRSLGVFANIALILSGENIGLSTRWGCGLVWQLRPKAGA